MYAISERFGLSGLNDVRRSVSKQRRIDAQAKQRLKTFGYCDQRPPRGSSCCSLLDDAALQQVVQSPSPVPTEAIGFQHHVMLSLAISPAIVTIQDVDK